MSSTGSWLSPGYPRTGRGARISVNRRELHSVVTCSTDLLDGELALLWRHSSRPSSTVITGPQLIPAPCDVGKWGKPAWFFRQRYTYQNMKNGQTCCWSAAGRVARCNSLLNGLLSHARTCKVKARDHYPRTDSTRQHGAPYNEVPVQSLASRFGTYFGPIPDATGLPARQRQPSKLRTRQRQPQSKLGTLGTLGTLRHHIFSLPSTVPDNTCLGTASGQRKANRQRITVSPGASICLDGRAYRCMSNNRALSKFGKRSEAIATDPVSRS